MNKQMEEIEGHFHAADRWFEPRAAPAGEVTVGIEAGTVPTAITTYLIDAGNNAYGSWVCVLGSSDTPCASLPGKTHYDLHKIGIQSCERTSLYYIQFGFGTVAGGVLTGVYTTIWFNPGSVAGKTEGILFNSYRRTCGTKVFARCLCPGQNTATINFNFAAHFYLI